MRWIVVGRANQAVELRLISRLERRCPGCSGQREGRAFGSVPPSRAAGVTVATCTYLGESSVMASVRTAEKAVLA